MSSEEFAALCAAFYAQYEPLIRLFAGALGGAGILAGALIGMVMAVREFQKAGSSL